MTPFVVYGAGGHARVVADVVLACGFELAGFVDDKMVVGTPVLGRMVLGSGEWLRDHDVNVALGIGNNRIRREIFETAQRFARRCPPLVHPTATIAPSATLRDGTVAMARVVVGLNVQVGVGVILNTRCIIGAECRLGDFTHISPCATMQPSAHARDQVHVGLGARVLAHTDLAEQAVIGAGASVEGVVKGGTVSIGRKTSRLE